MRMCWIVGVVTLVAMSGCAGGKPNHQSVVRGGGSHAVDEDVELRISAVGMTQMRYELWHTQTDRRLISDMGRDSKGWFFVWDDRDRLWAVRGSHASGCNLGASRAGRRPRGNPGIGLPSETQSSRSLTLQTADTMGRKT